MITIKKKKKKKKNKKKKKKKTKKITLGKSDLQKQSADENKKNIYETLLRLTKERQELKVKFL